MLTANVKAFIGDDSGATAIEYGLIAMLVCLAVIGSFMLVGNALINLYDNGTAELLAEQAAKIP